MISKISFELMNIMLNSIFFKLKKSKIMNDFHSRTITSINEHLNQEEFTKLRKILKLLNMFRNLQRRRSKLVILFANHKHF